MARTKDTTKSVDEVATEHSSVATDFETEDNMNENAVDNVKKKVNTKPLLDSDEIRVISLIPNVSYKDSHTGDFYNWEEVGHEELMTFETLKNMWRTSKSYFRNMCLKPLDDRVLNKFGLESVFEKHEFLMNESNYTKQNINKLCESISATPNGMKFAICNKIKNMVATEKLSDIAVIRALERHLGLDLISFLN